MKRFKGFIRKEFYHIFRDRRSLIILFGMPIVQIMLFGFAITNEIRNVDIAILDHAKDEVSAKIINKLLSSDYFRLYDYIENESQIEPIFRNGKVHAVIVFEPHIGKNLIQKGEGHVQIIADATEPNIANTINNYTSSIILDEQRYINRNNPVPYRITPQLRMYYNPELKGVFMFIPGTMTIILMLVSAMMTSISIAKEKETGTMEVLLVSPMNPLQVIAGKVFPYIFLSMINASIIILLGVFVFGMPMMGNVFALALVTFLFIITALCLGIFISTIANSQQTALMVSLMGLMLPTILLSGFIFPIASMPLPLQIISNIIPARWFIIIVKGLMLKGVSLSYLWKETGILLLIITVLTGLSYRNYKIRLE